MPVRTALVLALLASLSVAPASAAPGESAPPGRALSTPELLERAVERGRVNRATADLYLAYALADHRKVPDRFVSDAPWDGTLPLLRLQERLKGMPPGPARAAIGDALALGSCSGASGGPTSATTPHFFIEYGTIQAGLTIAEYAASLEASWTTEVDGFEWAAPPLPSTTPTPNRYHVVIANLGPGLYGFVSPSGTYAGFVGNNPNTAWNDVDAYASCMALNRNYSGFPSAPQASLDATTAHEFNHSIQFGLGAITGPNSPDDAFIEGGATWMEDEVFDDADDNYNYLWPDFTMSMGEYPTSPLPHPYSYWVVFRALTEPYGTGISDGGEEVMQMFWETVSQSGTSVDLDALNAALVAKSTTLADAYHAAAIALRFNLECGGSVDYPLCLEEGSEYVLLKGPPPLGGSISSAGGFFSGTVRDDYALNWVALPASGVYPVSLYNTSGGGHLRGTVACLSESSLSLTPLPAVVGAGASTVLPSFSPSGEGCTAAPVVVLTNQFQTAPNPSSSLARSYFLSTGVARSLAVSVVGAGMVSGNGINCPGDCFEVYPDGASASLSATPGGGSAFVGWSGDCSGSAATCDLVMSVDRSVTATFLGTKTVTLKAKPKKVDRGERSRLRAVVSPCAGHEGDVIQFLRKKKKVATKKSNGSCVAKVKVKVKRTSVYRAVSPQQDDDHLTGTSNKVKVRVQRA
jgi:Divergent InlB B-repeat domain